MPKLAIERDPGVASLFVLFELLGGDVDELAAGAGEVLPGLGQPDPLHERKAGLEGHLVAGVSCSQDFMKIVRSLAKW